MDLENALSAETAEPGEQNEPVARTDGLAASLAVEENVPSESAGGGQAAGEASKRGRPAIHGRYSQAAGSDGHRPAPTTIPVEFPQAGGNSQEVPVAPRIVVPADLLSRVIREGINGGEGFAANKIETVAKKAGLSREEIAPQLAQVALGEDRKQLVADLVPLAIKEWGLDPEMSPTAALLLLLGPWAFGAMTAYAELARLAAEKATRDQVEAAKKRP
jgi:hypothetical protein